jgi:hypothetical protein
LCRSACRTAWSNGPATVDCRAAIASQQQALQALTDLGEPGAHGLARNEFGLAQQEAGDYTGAASHQQALSLLRAAGEPHGQAQVLNSLGELASRTYDTGRARNHHSQWNPVTYWTPDLGSSTLPQVTDLAHNWPRLFNRHLTT